MEYNHIKMVEVFTGHVFFRYFNEKTFAIALRKSLENSGVTYICSGTTIYGKNYIAIEYGIKDEDRLNIPANLAKIYNQKKEVGRMAALQAIERFQNGNSLQFKFKIEWSRTMVRMTNDDDGVFVAFSSSSGCIISSEIVKGLITKYMGKVCGRTEDLAKAIKDANEDEFDKDEYKKYISNEIIYDALV